ncbi:hypothetical protein [Prevotella pectinovora]|uniref:hypothetical protein n=1 Tax=Prevotella pectinovora TaxID=1602169 RepID=UPI00307B9228
MNISDSLIYKEPFIHALEKVNANIDEYPSCKNLFYSGINLIKKDDLMHGLDDLRKAVEMLLKDLLHNNLSIEKQSQNRIKALLLKNGWKGRYLELWPMLIGQFKRYQNAYVKHDDGSKITEINTEITILQTLQIIELLITKNE